MRKILGILFLLTLVSVVYYGLFGSAAYFRSEREDTARLHIKILLDRHADEFTAVYKVAMREKSPPDIEVIDRQLGSKKDFWRQKLRIERSRDELIFTSAGPDGEFDTADDTTVRRSLE